MGPFGAARQCKFLGTFRHRRKRPRPSSRAAFQRRNRGLWPTTLDCRRPFAYVSRHVVSPPCPLASEGAPLRAGTLIGGAVGAVALGLAAFALTGSGRAHFGEGLSRPLYRIATVDRGLVQAEV